MRPFKHLGAHTSLVGEDLLKDPWKSKNPHGESSIGPCVCVLLCLRKRGSEIRCHLHGMHARMHAKDLYQVDCMADYGDNGTDWHQLCSRGLSLPETTATVSHSNLDATDGCGMQVDEGRPASLHYGSG